MIEMKVNSGELAAGGRGLEEAAGKIPEPLAPFTSTGTDALSTILATLTKAKEAPLINGLPVTKAEALATAQNIVTAAGMYERSDQQIATDVRNASAALEGSGGGSTGSAGGTNQMQQMMSMPMQVAQQAGQMAGQMAKSVGQLPQGVMQGVQSGIQQIGQMAGGAGQSGEAVEKKDPAGAEPGQNTAERAPASGSSESGAAPRRSDPEVVV